MPAVLSWGIDEPFPHSFWWTGTRDPSNWRSIETAFALSIALVKIASGTIIIRLSGKLPVF